MKHRFATAAVAALLAGGAASAQGIALFGDARLGLGYNIDNDGGILSTTTATPRRPAGHLAASASAST